MSYQRRNIKAIQSNEEFVQTQLEWGETLLWSGAPYGGIDNPTSFNIMPFVKTIFCYGALIGLLQYFAHLWGNEEITNRRHLPWWIYPPITLGICIYVSLPIIQLHLLQRKFYVVTNRRLIIVTKLGGRRMKSLDIHQHPPLYVDAKHDGNGTIIFGPMARNELSFIQHSPRFEKINNVREVYALIHKVSQGTIQ